VLIIAFCSLFLAGGHACSRERERERESRRLCCSPGVMDSSSSSSPFPSLRIVDNPDGWGPSVGSFSQFKSIPYAPFSKSEKLGRVSDWTGQGNIRSTGRSRQTEPGINSAIYFMHENDDDFQLVDLSKPQKSRYAGSRRYQQIKAQQLQRRRRNDERAQNQAQQQKRMGKQKLQQRSRYTSYRKWGTNQNDNKPLRDASVHVRKDWKQIEEFEFVSLQKVATSVNPPEDLRLCGSLHFYDENFDRVGTRTDRPLERHDRTFFNVSTSDDPIIQEYASQDENHIFITDTLLAVIMCATRSVYSWDLIIRKTGSKIFFDKRENSSLDYLTVNETAAEPPGDDKEDKTINCAEALAHEANYINQSFSQQVLSNQASPVTFEHPNPFVTPGEDENPASIGYRYRRFKLGDLNLVVRTELDGVQVSKEAGGKNQYLTIKALNEYDPKKDIDWRQKLDTQRGAVLATELKNNSNKLARWTIQSILAGTSTIKLGFVSRTNPKSQAHHVILGTQFYKPREFATQINLNVKNAWGIFKTIVDACARVDDGTYVLMKDPNKPTLRLYAVPENAFDNLDEEEEEDELDILPVTSGVSGLSLGGLLGTSGLGISPMLSNPSSLSENSKSVGKEAV
jgi:translation initiation factor 3 subunit D